MSAPRPSPFRCVILDFDGTFTQVEVEARPFEAAFRAALADVVGRPVDALWEEGQAYIRARPNAFGWTLNGKTVAPATSDPYLLATAVAQRVFDQVGILKNASIRTEVSQALYRDAYKHTANAFKPEAKGVLEALLRTDAQVVVVTNSHTEVVRKKLDLLNPEGRDRLEVVGDAKKFVIDPPDPLDDRFREVPETQSLEALPERPVLLHRGRYYEALRRIWEKAHAGPEDTLVCGDIYELDLSLPAALGSHVHLITSANTLAFEKEAVEAAGARGGLSESLEALLPRLGLV